MERQVIDEIQQLKKEKNAVILAHYYTWPEVQAIADFSGDSLGLSRKAGETDADIIVFAGVEFMAETASIISPEKKVLIPEGNLGCSLADCITAEKLRNWKSQYPEAVVVSYVNSTAEVKAESDYCCTSGNAVNVLKAIPEDKQILFCPDANLGAWAAKEAGREVILWKGGCHVHVAMNLAMLKKAAATYPDHEILMHPEASCSAEIPEELKEKTYIYSTAGMIKHVAASAKRKFLIATEPGILYELQQQNPEKEFVAIDSFLVCGSMKTITPEKILAALRSETRVVKVNDELAAKARKPIERMISINR
jgi:quinolinate synthase